MSNNSSTSTSQLNSQQKVVKQEDIAKTSIFPFLGNSALTLSAQIAHATAGCVWLGKNIYHQVKAYIGSPPTGRVQPTSTEVLLYPHENMKHHPGVYKCFTSNNVRVALVYNKETIHNFLWGRVYPRYNVIRCDYYAKPLFPRNFVYYISHYSDMLPLVRKIYPLWAPISFLVLPYAGLYLGNNLGKIIEK